MNLDSKQLKQFILDASDSLTLLSDACKKLKLLLDDKDNKVNKVEIN